MNVGTDVALVGDKRRSRVQAHPHPDRTRREPFANRPSRLHRSRRGREGNEERVPWLSTSLPPKRVQASRIRRRCSASAFEYLSAPSSSSSRVDPSTSLKRKVTVPDGRARSATAIMRQGQAVEEIAPPRF